MTLKETAFKMLHQFFNQADEKIINEIRKADIPDIRLELLAELDALHRVKKEMIITAEKNLT